MQKPTDYGFYLTEDEVYKPYHYKQVEINEDINDWSIFAKSQGITFKTLKHHNYWIVGNELRVNNKKEISVLIPHN